MRDSCILLNYSIYKGFEPKISFTENLFYIDLHRLFDLGQLLLQSHLIWLYYFYFLDMV